MKNISDWFKRQLENPQVVFLAVVLLLLLVTVVYAGHMLAPVLASLVIAYLLEGIVKLAGPVKLPRIVMVMLVFVGFLLFILLILFGLMPLLFNQTKEMVQSIPAILGEGQALLLRLPERYPELFSEQQVNDLIGAIRTELTGFGQKVLTISLSSVSGIITILVYFVLVPILVFFFLKDKNKIIRWMMGFLPEERQLAESVWIDVDKSIGNYIRGKFWEIVLVWAVTFVTFTYLQLKWAMLLAVLVGLSVIIPYIGAAAVTIPVALVGWFQWGWAESFAYLMAAYFVIQALDGNLLVPLLFSEVVNIHPVAIIVAILFFGGLWGFLGVFFAIPLATLVQAVLRAWPTDKVPRKLKKSTIK